MDERIARSAEFIKQNIDKNLRLTHMAEVACLSPLHYQKLFKFHMGVTPAKYVRRQKLEKAKEHLEKSEANILNISLHLGYKNYETFSRAFKKAYRIAPGDLRSILAVVRKKLQRTDNLSYQIVPVGQHMTIEDLKKESKNSSLLKKAGHVFIASQKDTFSHGDVKSVHNKFYLTQL